MITRQHFGKWMILTWLLPTLGLICFVALQTISGHFGKRYVDAWAWVCVTSMPMIGILLVVGIPAGVKKAINISGFHLFVALSVSIIYWMLVGATILLSPYSSWDIVELMTISNFWLAPMQCIVGAC